MRSWDLFIRGREIVKSGHLGKITMVNTWWYQNASAATRRMNLEAPKPEGLDWDRWQGPAPKYPYEAVRGPHLANMSYLEGRKVRWDAERNQPG